MYNERISHPLNKALRIVGMVILGIVAAVIFGLVFGYFIQRLWNWLMPSIFGVAKINYWQAFGLVLLARLMFGTIGHHYGHGEQRHRLHHPHHHKHLQWEHYSDDEWAVKGGWKNWKHYDSWWREEGKGAFENYIDRIEHKEENHE